MNTRILGLGIVVLAFGWLSAVALTEFGVVGLFAEGSANWATRQIFADLVIALSVALGFIIRDAREHGLPWVPYVIATLLTGSFGPLAYLIHRELALRPAVAGARATS